MAENVKLTRAEVISWSKSDNTILKEYKTEKGTLIYSFKVQTRVNDRADNSPHLYRKCSYFAKTEEEGKKIKGLVTKGAIIEIDGLTNRKSFDDKETGKKVYYEEIDVKSLMSIQSGKDATPAPEDLPF